MGTYQISFYKNLLGTNGRSFRCLQNQLQIGGVAGPRQAVERAAQQFERLHQIPRWNLRADCVDIAEVLTPVMDSPSIVVDEPA